MFPREIIQINHMLTYFATALLSHCSDVHTPCKNKLLKIEPIHTLTQILLNVILENEENKDNDHNCPNDAPHQSPQMTREVSWMNGKYMYKTISR